MAASKAKTPARRRRTTTTSKRRSGDVALTVSLDPDLHARAKERAAEEYRDLTSLIRYAVRVYVDGPRDGSRP